MKSSNTKQAPDNTVT